MQNESDKPKRKIALTLEDADGDVNKLGTIADFLDDPEMKEIPKPKWCKSLADIM